MRKITRKVVEAFFNNQAKTIGNTSIHYDGNEVVMRLHGNKIARKTDSGILISSAGWETTTTKERLNGILEYMNKPKIFQKDFTWYWKDKEEFKDGWNLI